MKEDIEEAIKEYENSKKKKLDLVAMLRKMAREGMDSGWVLTKEEKIEKLIKAYKELEERNHYLVQERQQYEEMLFKSKEHYIEKDKIIEVIDFSVQATNSNDNYSIGMCNGMLYIKSVILDKDIEYKKCHNNSISKEEIREKLKKLEMQINEQQRIINEFGEHEPNRKKLTMYKEQKWVLEELLEEE